MDRLFDSPPFDQSLSLDRSIPASKEPDQLVDQVMYALTGPLVGFPGWEDLLREHKDRITMYRLAHLPRIFKDKMATEFEAMLYISTASLVHLITDDWANIYGALFCKHFPQNAKEVWGEPPEIDPNQREDLDKLRRWLFRTQIAHLRRKARGESPWDKRAVQEDEEALEEKHRQLRLFQD